MPRNSKEFIANFDGCQPAARKCKSVPDSARDGEAVTGIANCAENLRRRSGTPGEIRTPDPLLRSQTRFSQTVQGFAAFPLRYTDSGLLLSLKETPVSCHWVRLLRHFLYSADEVAADSVWRKIQFLVEDFTRPAVYFRPEYILRFSGRCCYSRPWQLSPHCVAHPPAPLRDL